MESTKLLEEIIKIRSSIQPPKSYLEILRDSFVQNLARNSQIEMPPLLSNEQRTVFLNHISRVEEFLNTEDGADAVELLVNAFECFIETKIQAETKPVEDTPVQADVMVEDPHGDDQDEVES